MKLRMRRPGGITKSTNEVPLGGRGALGSRGLAAAADNADLPELDDDFFARAQTGLKCAQRRSRIPTTSWS